MLLLCDFGRLTCGDCVNWVTVRNISIITAASATSSLYMALQHSAGANAGGDRANRNASLLCGIKFIKQLAVN